MRTNPGPWRAALDALPEADVARYQSYWVTRARVLATLGRAKQAPDALRAAIAVTGDDAVREYLLGSEGGGAGS